MNQIIVPSWPTPSALITSVTHLTQHFRTSNKRNRTLYGALRSWSHLNILLSVGLTLARRVLLPFRARGSKEIKRKRLTTMSIHSTVRKAGHTPDTHTHTHPFDEFQWEPFRQDRGIISGFDESMMSSIWTNLLWMRSTSCCRKKSSSLFLSD